MKSFYFYGASDDLVEVHGAEDHEHNVLGDEVGRFTLANPDGQGVNVHVRLEPTGCWSAGMSPLDEDTAVPLSWQFLLAQATPKGTAPTYSAVLEAIVDDDATLTWEGDQ